jgi:hypothetical protein
MIPIIPPPVMLALSDPSRGARFAVFEELFVLVLDLIDYFPLSRTPLVLFLNCRFFPILSSVSPKMHALSYLLFDFSMIKCYWILAL